MTLYNQIKISFRDFKMLEKHFIFDLILIFYKILLIKNLM